MPPSSRQHGPDPRDLPAADPDLAPFTCAYCGHEMPAESEPWPETCEKCGRPLDVDTQVAFIRGRDAFIAGQEYFVSISPRKRLRNLSTAAEMEGLQYYNQAYTAIQHALQGRLAESQRRLGIEIMAAVSLVFQQHNAISILEAGYWSALMMELTMQLEAAHVERKIRLASPGLRGAFLRWRWQARLEQLRKALALQDERITNLERNIRFVEPPRARRKQLPPL